MMARCGRPELDSCPRAVGRGAPGRKRRRLVFAPPKFARNPPPQASAEPKPKQENTKPNSPGLSEAGYSKAGKPTARRRYNGGLQRAWLLTVAAGGDRGDFFSPGLSEAGYSKSRLRPFAALASLALNALPRRPQKRRPQAPFNRWPFG